MSLKDDLELNKPRRTPTHPTKSHVVKTTVDGKPKMIRFGQQGAKTAGKPSPNDTKQDIAKRKSFKARHASNIAKGPASAAYWADKVKWAEGGPVNGLEELLIKYEAEATQPPSEPTPSAPLFNADRVEQIAMDIMSLQNEAAPQPTSPPPNGVYATHVMPDGTIMAGATHNENTRDIADSYNKTNGYTKEDVDVIYDADKINKIAQGIMTENFAEGGPVIYNASRINEIANRILEEL